MSKIRTVNGYEYHDYGSSWESSFDYLRAWHELAYPAYEAMEDDLRKLVEETAVLTADLQQDRNLQMPWPEPSSIFRCVPQLLNFKLAFEVWADEQPTALAKAARVTYFTGHWFAKPILKSHFEPCGPGQWELIEPEEPLFSMVGRLLQEHGSHWKFSNYADQVLRERLGLPVKRAFSKNNSAYFQVLEGMLRLCLSYKNKQDGDGWLWHEVGLATPENLAKIRKLIDKWQDEGKCGSTPEATIGTPRTLEFIVNKLKKHRNNFEKAWLDTNKFMGKE